MEMHRAIGRTAAITLGAALIAGCGAEGTQGGDRDAAAGIDVRWEPCSATQGGGGPETSCALVALPLDWEAADGEALTVFVKRVRGAEATRRSLWMLGGEPGSSGAAFEAVVPELLALDPELEIFLVDHRGTGHSTPIGCPGEPFETGAAMGAWQACVVALEETWGERLQHFTTTAAAHDLGALLGATEEAGRSVHVYASSYGTVWAQRYLELFPDQVDGVTLDGMLDARGGLPFRVDAWHDAAGNALLSRCADDAACAARMGDDPRETVETFLAMLDESLCAPLDDGRVNRARMRQVFATMLQDEALRAAIPAVAYRGVRCEPGDVRAIFHAVDQVALMTAEGPERRTVSAALGMHVMLSELALDTPPEPEALEAIQDEAHVSPDRGSLYRALYDAWPRYEGASAPAALTRGATTAVPMLMLQGGLDPQVPLEVGQAIAGRYQGAHQTLVTLDPAVRGLGFGTGGAQAARGEAQACAMSMWLGFLKDPTAPVDASCTRSLSPISFGGSQGLAKTIFGTADLWDNEESAGDSTAP
ncbi:alpha/beta fold hydrolase [Chondromyces apiculatus]|nr:alpha/beta hydrolase [Chondromyces apiculatus]